MPEQHGDSGLLPSVPDNPWGLVAGLAAVGLIALVDLLLGPGPQLNGLFTTPPFMTAVFSGARRTALVGVVSVGVGIGMGNVGSEFTSSQGFRTGGVIVAALRCATCRHPRTRTSAVTSTRR